MKTKKERYDTIGIGYDDTRKADPYLAQRMYDLLHTGKEGGLYLDIGCGTGNYTSALQKKGMDFIGIEPSDEMLEKARVKNSEVRWQKGYAEQIELPDNSIDGVLISLTIHHWKDLNQGFSEVFRVLKPGAKFVLFTTLPEQTEGYWLRHYFPVMVKESAVVLPSLPIIKAAFDYAGLHIEKQERYFVRPDLQDGFFYCGKHDPERYFREDIRKGISSFSMIANQPEVDQGLLKLRKDIDSGKIKEVMKNYENDLGDYLFIQGKK